ncbi:5-oxoprolinase subunit PxpB [Burkholderia sp. MR1-5-21]
MKSTQAIIDMPQSSFPASADRYAPVVSRVGVGGLLFDLKCDTFDLAVQNRLLTLGKRLSSKKRQGITEVVPGVNNLLVLFDPIALHPDVAREMVLTCWPETAGVHYCGREFKIPVVYGGRAGEDLCWLAERAGLDIEEWVNLHSSAIYTVACIGAMPGFGYLMGMSARLAAPRRPEPRLQIPKGSVIIGGSQAGVQPCAAPSGWHLVGMTDAEFFDPEAETPCLLAPGDTVRFVTVAIEA